MNDLLLDGETPEEHKEEQKTIGKFWRGVDGELVILCLIHTLALPSKGLKALSRVD